jgi:surface antigen
VLLGGLVGGAIGERLDAADRHHAHRAVVVALEQAPTGQAVTWRNPDTGHRGQVVPLRTYQQAGTYCREFTQDLWIAGQAQHGYGRACRQPDGSWQIQ